MMIQPARRILSASMWVLLALSYAMVAADHGMSYPWINRPQLVAFTLEGLIDDASLSNLRVLDGIRNGELSCSPAINITWFARGCSESHAHAREVVAAGHEIGLDYTDDNQLNRDMACFSEMTTVTGIRSPPVIANPAIHAMVMKVGLLYETSRAVVEPSRSWPYLDHDLVQVPMFNPAVNGSLSRASLRSIFSRNYNGKRSPMVLSLSRLISEFGMSTTRAIIAEIMSYQEVVAVTTHQFKRLFYAGSDAEAESISNLCRNGVDSIPNDASLMPSSPSPTPVPSSPSPLTTPAPSSSLSPPSLSASSDPTAIPTTMVLSTPVPSSSSSTGAYPTTSPPSWDSQTTPPSSSDPAESSSGSSAAYAPYAIGIGGGLCAIAIVFVYKVYRKQDRFPPIVTGGYAFESEDRDIYDLEADHSAVHPISNMSDPQDNASLEFDSISLSE